MASKRGVILLVDDNVDDVELTLMAFEKMQLDADIIVAYDGLEALDYLFGTGRYAGRDVRELPRLVLLDLKMPRLDGLGLLKRIREDERTRYMPVVMLTSSTEKRDITESYQNWVNSYVRKPVNFKQFEEVSKQLGLYWALLNVTVPGGTHL
ncbi:two-component system, unclassified family, response regulator [Stigmatella aurantiaca]|uniref:Two-component system, unclassified family, response regulator n=1 Tax=Stigmatella aurantiaca TaxID=41 RepID=A0A1H7H957_STIAU|nr:response regulator [Stigmatella aurantiaca]SEK46791.1 two-component system, unclassified family, response regulator [Stigmatella aurantiaca]